MFILVWAIWIECKSCIFQGKHLSFFLIWDELVFFVSLWHFATGVFSGVSFPNVQKDWKALLI